MRVSLRWSVVAAALVGALAGSPAPAQMTPRADWKARFQAHDRNGDGRIDRAEFQEWMVDVFFQRDQGKKGYLTAEDVQGAMTPEVFKALSRRGDGKLELPEFLNALFQDFAAMDARHEGAISVEEIEAYIRQH
jgi:Ca2+-binding EF-hand superfamily protein